MRLAGKVALITGGGSGIGRAAALRFAREGAAVAVADLDRDAAESVTGEIGTSALALPCDVRREEQVASAVQAVRQRYGALHVLVTCAGILRGAFQAVSDLELATFQSVLEVNLAGTFLCCKHAVPLMQEAGSGVVLCVSSAGGVRGPSSSLAYGASKAAVNGFCLTLENQLAPLGVRVNVVCPGSLDTAMKRQNLRDMAAAQGLDPERVLAGASLGHPDGLAGVLAFLASDDADHVRGVIFTR